MFLFLFKKELIFLHWYHHVTVLIYCWFSYQDFASTGRWFMNMNFLVHSIMYSYFALKSMRIRVPLIVSKLITFMQILQMIIGIYINWVAYTVKLESECPISNENLLFSLLMYLSYFGLFFQFFFNAYVTSNAKHNRNKPKKIE